MPASRTDRRHARRDDIDPAALALIARHGTQVLATARRFSASLDDAEDAYQRALEILLTKAPTTTESELVPWLKTVVKHEAFAIRRQRERQTPTTDDGEVAERPTAEAATHDQAERWERLRLGAEAMRRLKPQEVRCLLLKAEGYSYKEICEITGWSYTKVNRCMTEGRRSFLRAVAGIEGGGECSRLEPLVSLLADGELSAEELKALRPHLKTCLTCRARLREYRAAPQRVAALVPPVALASASGSDAGPLRSFLESLLGATHDRAHAVAELATGQKAAALAASAAVVAGGGATVSQVAAPNHSPERTPAAETAPAETAPSSTAPVATSPSSAPPVVQAPAEQQQPESAAPTPAPSPAPAPAPAPDPAREFTPSPAPAPARATPQSAPNAAAGPSAAGSSSGNRSASGGGSAGGGSSEFAP